MPTLLTLATNQHAACAVQSDHFWLPYQMLFFRIHKFKIKFLVFTLNFSEQHTLTHTHTSVLWPFFWDHPGEPVPEENWTSWCKGRLTEADTLTIWLGATPPEQHTKQYKNETSHSCNSCKKLQQIKQHLLAEIQLV